MSKTILIIEDDEFLLGMESKKLTEKGYNVLPAVSSESAFKFIADPQNKIDLILLDLLLPETNGFDILKQIRENEKYGMTPVIVFSNLFDDGDVKKANALGANEFLIKANFTLDELAEKIFKLIG